MSDNRLKFRGVAAPSNLKTDPQSSNHGHANAVIDVVGHEMKTDEVVLVMREEGHWDGSNLQLHRLQERFNTYASYLLDGGLSDDHPELAGKRARIELRCAEMPDAGALELLGAIHDQLAFQEIRLEVIVRQKTDETGATRG